MSKYSDTLAKVTEQQAGLAKLEGYPKAPSWVGSACVPFVQADPTFGFTTAIAEVVNTKDGKGEVELDAALFTKWAGTQVVVDGKTVTIAAPPVKPAGEVEPKAAGEAVTK